MSKLKDLIKFRVSSNKANKTTYMIESVNDITLDMLKDKKVAAVSSGASTPTYLTNRICLESIDKAPSDSG